MFKWRSRRIVTDIPLKLGFINCLSGEISEQFCSAVMLNISKGGACVATEQMILGGRHLFFTTQKNKGFYLYLSKMGVIGEKLPGNLTAIAIWMNSFSESGKQSFKIGMKFTEKQHSIYKIVKDLP